jgi:hypothetical protein
MKIDFKSFLTGAALATIALISIAAAATRTPIPEISGLRFVVLDITPDGAAIAGKQRGVLRLARFYGKIDENSLDYRLKHETQEFRIVTTLDVPSTIQTNDIIGFQAYEHIKAGPHSRPVTHLRVTPKQ